MAENRNRIVDIKLDRQIAELLGESLSESPHPTEFNVDIADQIPSQISTDRYEIMAGKIGSFAAGLFPRFL